MKQFYLMMQTAENAASLHASPLHLTLSFYVRALMGASATLVVFISVSFSGAAIAKRLILLQEMCVCKQNPLYCVMKKAVSQLGNDVPAAQELAYTPMHTRTQSNTQI